MRARDVTLNKSELQRGCENANKICNGDVNCIREDFKSMDYNSSKSLTNQNQFWNPTQRSSGLWSQWFRWRLSLLLLPKRSSRFCNHWWCLLLQYVWWYCYCCWRYSRLRCILCRWRFLNDPRLTQRQWLIDLMSLSMIKSFIDSKLQ